MVSEEEWTDYIRYDAHLRNRRPSVVSIFRVPKFLKDAKREAYDPQRVSLGPYHHGSAELPSMGHHKGRALRRMMRRFNANKNLQVVQVDPNDMDFANRAMEEILNLENEIRDSYEENIACNGETLARMLCLDGCFLLEVLRTLAWDKDEPDECYDPIFAENKLRYAAQDVLNDLLILENQIPFIVLLKLLQLELNTPVDELNTRVDVQLFILAGRISNLFIPFDYINLDIEQWSLSCHHHLLDFLHTVIVSPPFPFNEDEGELVDVSMHIDFFSRMLQGKRKKRIDTDRIPHAVELRNAGIKFSALQRGYIKGIKFDENSATIFLPRISIEDQTETVFRNLIAYEMCKPSESNYVSSYAALMKDLIDTEEDVALMRRMGVLNNWLGSDKEVADLFNGLGEKVAVIREDVFHNLIEKVNALYNNEMMAKQMAKLVQDHFSSPWKALALTAAIVIFLLTVLQTIFTIISTYNK